MEFRKEEAEVLACLADAFLAAEEKEASRYWQQSGSQLVDPAVIAQALAAQPLAVQKEFRQLLRLLATPLPAVLVGLPPKPFCALRQTQREKLLRNWSSSRLPPLRKAFSSIKKLLLFLAYGHSAAGTNPLWEAIGYPGPAKEQLTSSGVLDILQPKQEKTLYCHTLIIGSGAGGGFVAAELAAAGYDVLVVDKGPYLSTEALSQCEAEMVGKLYEGRGALTTTDGAITLFAGSCLGGGTTINWAGSFAPPRWLRHEWASEHGLHELESPAFQENVDAVLQTLHVQTFPGQHNGQNQKLWQGSEKLGQHVSEIPRNERLSDTGPNTQLGYSCFGDKYGQKQSMLETCLKTAHKAGARLLPSTQIDRLLIEGGKAVGAEAQYETTDGKKIALRIRAERVVLAAGALQSPAILQRSGYQHPHLGRHLHLHPTVAVSGLYPEKIESWKGPMMSVVNDNFSRLKGNWGVKLETPPAHSGLIAMALPWQSSRQHREMMLKASQLASFIVLTRDKFGGEVRTDPQGKIRVQYALHRFDRMHMLRGMQEAARIHAAAGAEEVLFPHNELKSWKKGQPLEKCLKELPGWGWQPNRFLLFSAHQMGTVRMGEDAKAYPVAPDGSLRGIRNLYLADASLFPSASGVNPMITIMALARWIALQLR